MQAELGDKDRRYAVFISYVEVYNENIYDLLVRMSRPNCLTLKHTVVLFAANCSPPNR